MRHYPVKLNQSAKVVHMIDSSDLDIDSNDNIKPVSQAQLVRKAQDLLEVRKRLHVYQNREQILWQLRQNQVTILVGETGSGKSTQIPQLLLEEWKKINKKGGIAVTQPRRVAAINLASRVAQEHGCILGAEVGYSVRFDMRAQPSKTRLKYVTDGMLLREIMLDGNLKQYGCIIIDEAHERTILTDLILGVLKQLLQTTRPDLRIVVMSATLQAERFSKFFNDAPILFVEGRNFPVDVFYLAQTCDDIVDGMVRCCVQLNSTEAQGDILCFLPGQEEIDKVVGVLNKISDYLDKNAPRIIALPLYAALPPAEQARVFHSVKGFKRKIILSTNIAETSVTITGVKYVVDSGLRKCKIWRQQLGLATLLTVPISKASASQRAGRAGRESPGKCFRMFREQDYEQLPDHNEAEIAYCDVTAPLLMLKQLGISDIINWTWLEHPGHDSILHALQELYLLSAIDDDGKITEDGRTMALLPLPPQLSKVIIEANKNDCLAVVLDIVACLSVENLLLNPSPELRDEVNVRRLAHCSFGAHYGDLVMLKELYDQYKSFTATHERLKWCQQLCVSNRGFRNVLKIRAQLQDYVSSLHWDVLSTSSFTNCDHKLIQTVIKSFLVAFVRNTAIAIPDRTYKTTLHGESIFIHPSSLLFITGTRISSDSKNTPEFSSLLSRPPAILYNEYVFTTKGYARCVSRLELEWLQNSKPSMNIKSEA